jgi:hypothetical protein
MITGAPWYVSNLTLHNDIKIPFVREEIILHANRYKLRTTGHSVQLISELYYQSNEVEKVPKIWPEVGSCREQSVDGI